jgi:hypothetical protein
LSECRKPPVRKPCWTNNCAPTGRVRWADCSTKPYPRSCW